MKKFLSLVLALVMVMSLVTVSAGAKDFTDDDKITYDEAVAVISTIGVVDGDTNGAFRPTDTLTRQAAAKIICNLILGPTTAAELHADTAPYKDVAVNNQFAGYIAYCQSKGIISGYADGTFRPTGTLTGYAFMKMLLGALGYDSSLEGYVGTNWSINVAKQALGLKLNKGLEGEFNGIKAVTREEACLYAFRTIQADLVEYNQRVTTNINGTEVTLSSGGAQSRKWDSQQSRYDYIRDDNIIQFAEEYFNKLEKKKDTDDFERPAYTWVYDKKTIGTYVDWELMVEEYTTGVSGRDVYDLLGSAVIRDNDLVYYVNGLVPGAGNITAAASKDIEKTHLVRSNQDDIGITDDGVLTQIFLDKDANLISVISVNTWLAQANGDYSESKEYAPMKVFFDYSNRKITEKGWNVDVEDVPSVVDVKDEDFYLVNITWKNNANGDVVMIQEPDVMEDSAVTKFSINSAKLPTKLTTGGTEYKKAQKAFYDADALYEYDENLLTDKTYTVFMDQYGYFIGVSLYEGTKNYVFITGFDRPTSNISIKTADAVGIFLDGTMDQIKVNVTDTDKNIERARDAFTKSSALTNAEIDAAYGAGYFAKWSSGTQLGGQFYYDGTAGQNNLNRWYTYTVNANGVYTLKPATRMTASWYKDETTIKTANVSVLDNILQGYGDGVKNGQGDKFLFATDVNEQGYDYITRAYGNDDSVYITVDTGDVDTLTAVNGNNLKAITDVNGVYTGVQNVEIDIDDSTGVDEAQVYTVYDKNWFIIGAVVVGEGNGSNGTIVKLLSTEAKSEWIEDGTYYWDIEIYDGAKKDVTIKSKYPDTFNVIKRDADGVVELRMDADGYVTKVLNLNEAEDLYTNYNQEKIDDYKVYRMNYLAEDVYAPTTLEMRGNTLYVTSNRVDRGLALRADATALTIQNENNKTNVKTEHASVSAAISHLQDNNTTMDGFQFYGSIIAALDGNGAAKWVIFYQPSNVWLTTGNNPNYDYAGIKVEIDGSRMKITAPAGTGADSIARAIEDKLVSDGYDDITVSVSGDTVTARAKKGYTTYSFSISRYVTENVQQEEIKTSLGGKDTQAAAADPTTAAKVSVPAQTTELADDANGRATVEEAVKAAMSGSSMDNVVVETVEFNGATNGTEGSPAGTPGSAVVKVTMTKNGVTSTTYVKVALAAKAYQAADTSGDLVKATNAVKGMDAKIDAADPAIASFTEDLKTAILAKANKAIKDIMGDQDYTAIRATNAAQTENSVFKAANNTNGTNGQVQVTITLTGDSTVDVWVTLLANNTQRDLVDKIAITGGVLAEDSSAINASDVSAWMKPANTVNVTVANGKVTATGTISAPATAENFTGKPWFFTEGEGNTDNHFLLFLAIPKPTGATKAVRIGHPSDKTYDLSGAGLTLAHLMPYDAATGKGGSDGEIVFDWYKGDVLLGRTTLTIDASGVTVTKAAS